MKNIFSIRRLRPSGRFSLIRIAEISLLMLLSCNDPRSRITFRLDQGSEFCKEIPLTSSDRPLAVDKHGYAFGPLSYFRSPNDSGSIVATTGGFKKFPGRADEGAKSVIIRFKDKTSGTVPNDFGLWRTWEELGAFDDDLRKAGKIVDLGRTRATDDPMVRRVRVVESYGLSGEFVFARYSPGDKYVSAWSKRDTGSIQNDLIGETYVEVFRVSDKKRLVKATYDRYRAISFEVEHSDVVASDSNYFIPIGDFAKTGLVCYFPPEIFK